MGQHLSGALSAAANTLEVHFHLKVKLGEVGGKNQYRPRTSAQILFLIKLQMLLISVSPSDAQGQE